MDTDFLASGNHFFLPFSDTRATDSFIFPSNENIFVNKSCILVSQSGFYGYCKPLFYIFSRHWKCIFETNIWFWLMETGCLSSGNHFFLIFRYSWQFKLFSTYCKFIFTTNPLFWLVETDFLANENHFVPVPQISFLSSFSISWKYILNESFTTASGNGFSVWWERYSFIHIFFETITAIRGRPIF